MSVKHMLNFIAAIRGLSGLEKRSQVAQVAARLELLPVLDCAISVLPPLMTQSGNGPGAPAFTKPSPTAHREAETAKAHRG